MTDSVPDGLSVMNYAAKICEDSLGWPAVRSNLELVGMCLESVAKKWRRSNRAAYIWMEKRIAAAKEAGIEINGMWFRQGEYNNRIPGQDHYDEPKRMTEADWQAVKADRASYFAGPQYQEFLKRMKTDRGI